MMLIVLLVAARWTTDIARQNDAGRWLKGARRDALSRIAGQARDADEQVPAAYNRVLARLADQEARLGNRAGSLPR